MGALRHPLLNKKVHVVWAEPTPVRPTTVYVAFVDTALGFIRFSNDNDWAAATWRSWVRLDEIIQMDEVRDE